MSEEYIFTPNKTNSSVIAWETPPVAFNINQSDGNLTESMNESYVTAIDDDTHYLSILDSSNERTLEALHDLSLENEELEDGNVESLTEDCNETDEQQMLIFNMDGLDDLYGIQFARDEDGILQKYQFKFRQNENGALEAVPETIQVLPNNETPEPDQDYDETVVGDDNFESFANAQMLDVDRSSEHSERDFDDFNCFKSGQELNLELNEGSDDSNQIEDDDVHDFDKRSEPTEIKPENVSDHKVAILHEFNYINELNGNDAVELETEDSHDGYDNILLDDKPKLKEIRLHDSDNIEYDIDDDFSISDSKDLVQSVLETSAAALKAENSHILRQALAGNTTETNKKVKKLYYVIPTPEKENLTTLEAFKPNPRSILKPQPIKTKLPSPNNEALKSLEKLERRYSRSREAVEAKMFNNFINKTTVPQVPVRQTRLPRKQEIKPVDNRREEEIIVKEVMISSNGFIESVEDRFKNKDKLEIVSYITLEDSDEENPRSKGKKKKESVIEILSSDDESSSKPKTIKRGRGRPRKSEAAIKKRDHNDQHEDLIPEESSPSKKSRSDSSSKDSDLKQELNCPHCPKTFPSPNSLKTHIQHHNLENRMQKRMTTFQYKHKCEDCDLTFKNVLLLQRHDCKKKIKTEICKKVLNDMAALNLQNVASKYVCSKCQTSFKNTVLQSRHVCPEENKWQCGACKAKFNHVTLFNAHKRKHMKESMMMKTTDVQIPVRKSLDAKSDKSVRQSMIPTKILPSIKVAKKFSCQNCHMKFTSRLLLDTHKRRSCVKPKMDSKPKLTNVSPKKRCVQCTECQEKFKTYSDMTKHKIEKHGCASTQKSMKRKCGGKVKYMSGIPPNPKIKEAFQYLAKSLDDLPK